MSMKTILITGAVGFSCDDECAYKAGRRGRTPRITL